MQDNEIQIALVIMVVILVSSSLSLWQVYKDYKLQNTLPTQTVVSVWGTYTLFSIFTVFAALHSFWPILSLVGQFRKSWGHYSASAGQLFVWQG